MEISDPAPPMASVGPIGPPMFLQRKVRIRIGEALLGVDPKQQEIVIETGQGGGDCGYDFRRGADYLVYASKKPDGSYYAGTCSPTRPLVDAAEDLKYFHGLGQASPTTEVRVTAWDVQGGWRTGSSGRQELPALAGARVTVTGAGVRETATTDGTGRHVFSALPPGEYKVEGSLEGYAGADVLRPVQAHSKGCVEVVLALHLDRVVKGRVSGKDGKPMEGILVEAVATRARSVGEIPMAADSAKTDGNGEYELRRLSTGEYYLGVSLGTAPTLGSPYTRWFYPGVEDPAAAGTVHVPDRPAVLRFDLTLPEAQQERTIRGTVFWPDGRGAAGANVFLEDPRYPWTSIGVVTRTDEEGRFVAQALDGTRYRLRAAAIAGGLVSTEPVGIEAGASALDLELVLTRKGNGPRQEMVDWRKGVGRM